MSIRKITILLFLSLAPFSKVLALDDFAVISPDGKYIKYDINDFSIKDVGDLRRIGIFRIDGFAKGSTVNESIALSEIYKTFNEDNKISSHQNSKIFLEDIGSNFSFLDSGIGFYTENGNKEFFLLGSHPDLDIISVDRFDKNKILRITFFDENLNTIRYEKIPMSSEAGEIAPCREDKKITLAFGYDIVEILPDGFHSKPISRDQMLYTLPIYSHCIVAMKSATKTGFNENVIFFDLRKQKQISRISIPRWSKFFIFPSEEKILLQKYANPPTTEHLSNHEPGNTLSILDLKTGKVSLSKNFTEPVGWIEKISTNSNSQIVFLKYNRKLRILDLRTLEIIKTLEVPFDNYHLL